MASSVSSQPTKPWQRFTVLDALLLQVGYALAYALLLTPFRDRAFHRIDAGSFFLIVTTVCLGSVLSGPIILGSHWLLRGRRGGLSAGEWLWLSPIAIALFGVLCFWAIHWIAYVLPDPDEIRAILYALLGLVLFLMQIGCMVNALLVALARWLGDLTHPPCGWTDRFGAVTCLVIGSFLVLTVLAVLS